MRNTFHTRDEQSRPKNQITSDYERILQADLNRRKTFSTRDRPKHNPHPHLETPYLHTTDANPKQNKSESHQSSLSPAPTNNKLKIIPVLRNYEQDRLDFSHNSIRKIENLQMIKHLRVLNLSNNCIAKVENIFMLKKLEELNLGHNFIEELPRDMGAMKGLRKLYLNDNRLTSLQSLDYIKPLYLTHLTLDNNYFCKLPDFKRFVAEWFRQLAKKAQTIQKHSKLKREKQQEITPFQGHQHQDSVVLREYQSQKSAQIKAKTDQHIASTITKRTKDQQNNASVRPPPVAPRTAREYMDESMLIPSAELHSARKTSSAGKSKSDIGQSTQKINIVRADNQKKRLGQNINEVSRVVGYKKQGLVNIAAEVSQTVQNIKDLASGDVQMIKEMQTYLEVGEGDYIHIFSCALGLFSSFESLVIPFELRLHDLLEILVKDGPHKTQLKQHYETVERQSKQLSSQLSLLSMELINGESELFLKGQNKQTLPPQVRDYRARIRQYLKQFNKLQKTLTAICIEIKEYLSQWCYYMQLESLAGLTGTPSKQQEPSSELKRVVFSVLESSDAKRERSALTEELRMVSERYHEEAEEVKRLRQQLDKSETENQQLRLSIGQLRGDFEERLSQMLQERNVFQQKWDSLQLFNRSTDALYNTIFDRQTSISSMMKEKLTMDFFQQILLTQTLTIQDLLKANKQSQALYLQTINRERQEMKLHQASRMHNDHTQKTKNMQHSSTQLYNTATTPFPGESSKGKASNQLKGNSVSEFSIQEQSYSKNNNKSEFFKKSSSGFTFKKPNLGTQPNLKSAKRTNTIVSTQKKQHEQSIQRGLSSSSHKKYDFSGMQGPTAMASAVSLSRGKMTSEKTLGPVRAGPSAISYQDDKQNRNPNTVMSVDSRHAHYEQGEVEQAKSYRNYLKFYLRNNIAEMLDKSEKQAGRLKGKWGKEELKHHKFHMMVGPKLIHKKS